MNTNNDVGIGIEEINLDKYGFEAKYYSGRISPDKAIIAVGGASCDERSSIAMSGYLRKAGYNVLVLGFYMWDGMERIFLFLRGN